MNKISTFLVLLILPIIAMADNVSNVRVQRHHADFVITYDLSKTSNVQLLMSIGGSSLQPLEDVEGAVGKRVKAGEGLTITWHPQQEISPAIAENIHFEIEALDWHELYILPKSHRGTLLGGMSNMESYVLVDFAVSGAPQTSFGLTFGQTYSGIGWFVDARTNFHFKGATDGMSCYSSGYVGSVLPFYSGKTYSSLFSFHGGVVIDFLDLAGTSNNNRFNTFGMYVGLGYGFRRLFWETSDGKLVAYLPDTYQGFSGNIGLIGSIRGFTIKAGMNTIGFQYLEFELGLGWMF